jgi:hypothetical protein
MPRPRSHITENQAMPRDPRYEILFEPMRIGPVTAKNRFIQVAHCPARSPFSTPPRWGLNRMPVIGHCRKRGVFCLSSCAIQANTGIVVCWGNDPLRQLTPPDAVNGVSGTAVAISSGGDHNLAIALPEAGVSTALGSGIVMLAILNRRRRSVAAHAGETACGVRLTT